MINLGLLPFVRAVVPYRSTSWQGEAPALSR